ncbi:MAG: PKD domain-containing protein, partial [Chitinophagales bacterium]|nr:PKD domain-containing protein [Chitinophagales bacterium]
LSYPTVFTNQSILKTGTQVQQYFWDFGDGNSSASQNTTHTYSSYGNFAVKLRLDYGNNCFDSIIKQIQVNPNPIASFTVNDICNDSTLVANDNSTIPAGTLNYTWKWGDGSTSVGLPANHKYNSSGNYTISVTVTSDKGCADSATRSATVILGGKPDFSATEVCYSYPTAFTNQTVLKTGTQVQQYFWDFGDGNSSASQNPNHTYTSHGNYAVKFLLDYGNGCLDSVEKIVKVFEKPVASFTADTVCERNFTQFTNNSSPTGLLYNWDFGDGNSSTTYAPKHLYANDGIYQVKLIARTQESCYDSVIKPVQVLKVGNALFEVNTVCIGNTSFFVNRTDTISTPVNSFLWDFGDGTQSNQTNPQKQYNSTGNYQVKMISYFSNGCSDTILKLAIVNDKPVVEVTKKDLSCFKSYDGEINLTPLSGPNPFNFIWSPSLPNASLQQMLAAGKYNVTFTDANNCSDTLSVILYQPDSLTLYIDIDSVLCFGNADGRLRAFVTGGTPPYIYRWSNGVSQLENKNLSSGNYFVTVIDQNGCSISGSAVVPQPQKFEVTLKAEDTINLGESITLQPLYNYPRVNYWMWSPSAGLSCTDCENPVAMPYKDIIYTVIAISEKGCIDTSFTKINVQHTPVIYVPNLFTPNRDDINDVVKIYANYAKEVDFKIFNRWGEKVFEGKSLDEGWDGYYKNELCEPGVYVYTVTVTYLDDKKVTCSGSITLVR